MHPDRDEFTVDTSVPASQDTASRMLRLTLLAALLTSLGPVRGADNPSAFTESVTVRSFYICDGYESFGEAAFYDCARRFFMDGAVPTDVEDVKGRWKCRSSFNGPSADWEQIVKVTHFRKAKQGIDKLLVAQVDDRNPAPKTMYRWSQPGPFAARVGEIARRDTDWTSTGWAYGEKPAPLDLGGRAISLYDARATFRIYRKRLLVEHVVRESEKDHVLAMMSRSPSGFERLLHGGNPFKPHWTAQTLRDSTPVAEYDEDWTFPIMYSECRHRW